MKNDPRFEKKLILIQPRGKKRAKSVQRVRFIYHPTDERELALILASGEFSQTQMNAIAGGEPVTKDVRLHILKIIQAEVDRTHAEALSEEMEATAPPASEVPLESSETAPEI